MYVICSYFCKKKKEYTIILIHPKNIFSFCIFLYSIHCSVFICFQFDTLVFFVPLKKGKIEKENKTAR